MLQRDLVRGAAGAVIFCDLDHLAAFNNINGHIHGDQVLRLVATTLATPNDAPSHYAYRMGGDEFLVRLPGADLQTATGLAEEARRKIKQLPAAVPATQPEEQPLTARFVVAAWREGEAPSDTTLLDAAARILSRPVRDAVLTIDDDGDEDRGAGLREPRRPPPKAPSAPDSVDPSA